MSERDTEQIIEEFYAEYRKKNEIVFERQNSKNKRISPLVTSKGGGKNKGFPEFYITSPSHPDWVVVIECKEELSNHQSADVEYLISNEKSWKPVGYAVDGCLHYMECLSQAFNVIGVAVSGTASDHKVSVFFQKKTEKRQVLVDPSSRQPVEALLSFRQYVDLLDEEKILKGKQSFENLKKVAKQLHEDYRNNFSLAENQKPLFASATLLALEDNDFRETFANASFGGKPKTADDLIDKMISAIRTVLKNSDVPSSKIETMLDEFKFIKNDEAIKKINTATKKLFLLESLEYVRDEVKNKLIEHIELDLIGMFYGEFVRYTGGDGKGLGIVLTPRHITELMCKLARIDSDSIVLDPCCGTGGFLIAAMKEMFEDVNRRELDPYARELRIHQIKNHQLIGVETKGFLYTMACANMIFRGDGKANIYHASCFDKFKEIAGRKFEKVDLSHGSMRQQVLDLYNNGKDLTRSPSERYKSIKTNIALSSGRPNKCLMNPPYSQEKKKTKGDDGPKLHELDFIFESLEVLEKGGALVCIVPISVAFGMQKKDIERRRAILKRHRLDAVLSMPGDLFYPVGTHTCIMVFSAHERHDSETWFAYCKDDGFSIDRIQGRSDTKGKWANTCVDWVARFKNKSIEDKYFAVKRKVSAEDEWCAEAYIETNYESFSDADLDSFISKFQLAMINLRYGNV